MRGKILLKALELIKDGALSQADFFNAVLQAGYGSSIGKLDYEYTKIRRRRKEKEFLKDELRQRKLRLQKFIYKMKRDGLIGEIGSKDKKVKILERGRQKIGQLKSKLPDKNYKTENKTKLTIVSFDIPEKFRGKRDWLREVLRNLGFNMVHQSVWVGNIKVPEAFVNDLEDIKILEFVEIFEVSKSGTLERI